MILTTSVQGFDTAGMNISAFDLAPNYVAPLSAIVHTVHSAASFFAPYIIGVLTPHVRNSIKLNSIMYLIKSEIKTIFRLIYQNGD